MLTETLQVRKNELENSLTDREIEVLKLLAQGKTNAGIANILIISKHTAKAHVGHIIKKLKANDRLHAVIIAIKKGIIKY